MKCRVKMKCPDSLRNSIEAMAEDEIGRSDDPEIDAELDGDFDNLVSKCLRTAERWFRYGENITVELDFDKGTCIVVEN